MKIGIYLVYPPHSTKFSLKQEGLGRYIASLLEALINQNHKITIACPFWSISAIYELLNSVNIDKDFVEFLYPRSTPLLLKWIYNKEERKRRKRKKKIHTSLIKNMDNLFISMILVKNHIIMFLLIVLIIFAFLLCIPISVMIILYYVIKGFLSKSLEKKNLKNNVKKCLNIGIFSKIYWHYKQKFSSVDIKEMLRLDSAKQIARLIKGMAEPVDLWYSPTAFWPEFNDITGVKVICAPDLVTKEFATNFSRNDYSSYSTNMVRNTIKRGTNFITYSEYLKTSLLINTFGKDEKNIVAIPHAVNETKPYIDVRECFCRPGLNYDVNLRYAKDVLKGLRDINQSEYIRGCDCRGFFDFSDIKYIFYASQARENKNILSLIKAYEYLLREKNIKVKLFLTCNFDPIIQKYIYQKRLQYDILPFHGCTNQQLAALYKCAELSVNPTLYEGGFPFTFGEGMSVGTPSVMGKIPQVLEGIGNFELDCCLFNPYDYKDIAQKIIYGLEHREELYNLQKPLFEKMMERTWTDVGNEYIQAFQYFINKRI